MELNLFNVWKVKEWAVRIVFRGVLQNDDWRILLCSIVPWEGFSSDSNRIVQVILHVRNNTGIIRL